MPVRVDLNLTLDGFATAADPMGEDWGRMTAAYAATRTFRQRVLHDDSGAGTTGVDERYAREYFEGVGAEVMGAAMFGLHAHPGDPDWRGWWGEEPPFDYPVFVLTHETRAPIEVGATTFHFLQATPEEALARAVEAAGSADVRIGGGARTVRSFLEAGLVDRLHVAVAPILLGGRGGIRLWDDLDRLEEGYTVTTEVAESGTIHVVFAR